MSTTPAKRGRVAVIGAGPAGMATALSVHQAGHDVILLERYHQARPAGNILNLWPPPIKALGLLGVDTNDLGAPCYSEFRSAAGHTRVRVEPARRGCERLRRRVHRPASPRALRTAARRAAAGRAAGRPRREQLRPGRHRRAAAHGRRRGHRGRRSGRRRRHRLPRPPHPVGRCPQAGAQPAHLRRVHLRRDRARREGAVHRFPQPHRAGQLDLHPQPRAATAFSGGSSAPTTPAPNSPATCTPPPRRWAPNSPLRSRS